MTIFLSCLFGFNIILMLFGIIICLSCERRKYFWIMFPLMLLPYAFFCNTVVWRLVFNVTFGDYSDLIFIAFYIISCLMLFAWFKIDITQALLIGSIGYIFQHLVFNLQMYLRLLLQLEMNSAEYFIIYTVITIVFAVAAFFVLTRKVLKQPFSYGIVLNIAIAAVTVLLVCILHTFSNKDGATGGMYIYRICLCLSLIGYHVILAHISFVRYERKVLQNLLIRSEKQREMSKENIDLINRKCHDLKHQIGLLKAIDNETTRKEAIEELENAVMIYQSMIKTGNITLDTVLAEKNLIWNNYKIDFSFAGDASLLDFISVVDIYTLFGNAVDNAIEAVHELNEDERSITLKIMSSRGIMKINFENYMAGDIVLKDGLPVTTKENNGYHGYGMKSINIIVEKYKGHMTITQQNNIFSLNIIFGLDNNKT